MPLGVYPRKSLSERFWAKVDKNGTLPPTCPERGPCWKWRGATLPWGYGKLGNKGKTPTAHRVSWEIHFGPVPEGLFVLHYCDNPPCTNPAHLFLGTNDLNRQDSVAKKRQARGSALPQAKLTEMDVAAIRSDHNHGTPLYELIHRYKLSQSAISNVIARRTWRHVP